MKSPISSKDTKVGSIGGKHNAMSTSARDQQDRHLILTYEPVVINASHSLLCGADERGGGFGQHHLESPVIRTDRWGRHQRIAIYTATRNDISFN